MLAVMGSAEIILRDTCMVEDLGDEGEEKNRRCWAEGRDFFP